MDKITIRQATVLTSPNPVTLICTERPDGGTNLAPVSFWSYMAYKPATIGFALLKPSYSGDLIRANKQVALAMPSAEIADESMKCSKTSGRDVDKVKEYNIKLTNIEDCPIKVPEESRLIFDCTLYETLDLGDHYYYVCRINNIYADDSKEQVFAWDGYKKIHPIR